MGKGERTSPSTYGPLVWALNSESTTPLQATFKLGAHSSEASKEGPGPILGARRKSLGTGEVWGSPTSNPAPYGPYLLVFRGTSERTGNKPKTISFVRSEHKTLQSRSSTGNHTDKPTYGPTYHHLLSPLALRAGNSRGTRAQCKSHIQISAAGIAQAVKGIEEPRTGER